MHYSGRCGPVSPERGHQHLNEVPLLAMDSTNTDLHASGNKFALTDIERMAVELLSILLADIATDA
jgi:hypothetical protein